MTVKIGAPLKNASRTRYAVAAGRKFRVTSWEDPGWYEIDEVHPDGGLSYAGCARGLAGVHARLTEIVAASRITPYAD